MCTDWLRPYCVQKQTHTLIECGVRTDAEHDIVMANPPICLSDQFQYSSVRFVKKKHWGVADRREGRGAAGTNM